MLAFGGFLLTHATFRPEGLCHPISLLFLLLHIFIPPFLWDLHQDQSDSPPVRVHLIARQHRDARAQVGVPIRIRIAGEVKAPHGRTDLVEVSLPDEGDDGRWCRG